MQFDDFNYSEWLRQSKSITWNVTKLGSKMTHIICHIAAKFGHFWSNTFHEYLFNILKKYYLKDDQTWQQNDSLYLSYLLPSLVIFEVILSGYVLIIQINGVNDVIKLKPRTETW